MRGVYDSPYQWCGELTAPLIYGEFFKKYLEEVKVVCIFFLSFFLLIGAKLFFFSQISAPYINNTRSRRIPVSLMRGVDDSPYQWCGESTARESTAREIETKAQMYRSRSLLSEQNQNILIWSAYYQNKSRTFQSVPKLFKIELERLAFFKVQKRNQNGTELILIGPKRFHTPMLQRKQNRTLNYFQIFY
jgi:hypothetical protein